MPEPHRCLVCQEPIDGRPARLCEHLATVPLVPTRRIEEPQCASCEDAPETALEVLCDPCASARLADAVEIGSADEARGWVVAPARAVAAYRGHPLHPLAQLRPGRWAKLSFVTVPMRTPRHVESMWIKITRSSDEGWHGTLDNEPEVLTELELGSPLVFQDDQVVRVAMDTESRELPVGEHACEVCDLELRRARQELDDGDEALLEATGMFGFMVFRIAADDEGPAFAFTVGLAHRFDHPELICFGPDPDILGELVRDVANQVAAGARFEDGELRADLLHRASVRFEALPSNAEDSDAEDTNPEDTRREYLGYACWFHRNATFPVQQIVWSDRAGRFPDAPDFAPELAPWQPLLRR